MARGLRGSDDAQGRHLLRPSRVLPALRQAAAVTPDEQMSAAREALVELGSHYNPSRALDALLQILDLHSPTAQSDGVWCQGCAQWPRIANEWPCSSARIVLSAILGGDQ